MLRCALWILTSAALTPGPMFAGELRGRVTGANGIELQAMLFGIEAPFETSVIVGHDGTFRFRSIEPGQYTVAIVRPNMGEIRRTVFVSAGVVELTIAYAGIDHSLGTVSSHRLTIPAKAMAKYREAQASLGKRDAERAEIFLREALDIAPEFSSALNMLGVISFQKAQDDEAEKYFRRALAAEPHSFEAVVNLGGVLLKHNRSDEARPYNERAVHDRPQDALANAQLGINYFQLGRFEEAEKYLLAAKASDPAHFTQPDAFLTAIRARRQKTQAEGSD